VENQKIEWKRQRRDEFLKGLCGLANAQGGTLEIGRGDDGVVVGVDNAKKLLEELPNTIRLTLGIVPSVELLTEGGRDYIAVRVEASGAPVCFHGRYYLRSGSTTMELNGGLLNSFILRRVGKTWDGITIPNVKITDLDTSAFRIFREKAVAYERLRTADLEMSNEALLESLSLVEGGELTRAAVLLFHSNPEKYVFGAFVKVGYFETGADLIYQDEFHGSLITVADQIVDTIYRKYFKGIIGYEGILRVTDYPVPRPALREAIFNAIVHRDYTTGIPIQIKVFPDSVTIYNDGTLPEHWTVVDLLSTHRSRPHNPKIANTFFRSGFIETWGRGIERITTACREAGKREPLFEVSSGEVKVTFYIDDEGGVNRSGKEVDGSVTGGVSGGVTGGENGGVSGSVISGVNGGVAGGAIGGVSGGVNGVPGGVNELRKTILELMRATPTISAQRIADTVGTTKRRIESNINVMKKAGLLNRIGTDKKGHWDVIAYDTNGGVSGGANGGVNTVGGGAPGGIDGGVNGGVRGGENIADGGVNELRKAILERMLKTPTISAQRIAAALGTTKRRVESNIHTMKKAGLVNRVGSDKAGRWEVRYGGRA